MSSTVSIILALVSAGCAAVASVLQHRSARDAPTGRGMRIGLIGALLRRPMWLIGVAAAGVAFLLHAAALQGGQLVVIQPLLVSSLLFALPASALLEHRRPSIVEWCWALLLLIGLVGFLGLGYSSAGSEPPTLSVLIPVLAAAGACAALSVFLGGIPLRRFRPGLFGLATGIAYGIVAALIKYAVDIGVSDPIQLVTSWPLYVLIIVGACAVVLNQTAYQAGALAAALPALMLADPVAAVLIGVIAFGERFGTEPLALAGQIVGALMAGAAVVQLARREAAGIDRAGHAAGR